MTTFGDTEPADLIDALTARVRSASTGGYLLWLPDVLRRAGLAVTEYAGWQTRAKASGGYADPSRPWGVMWHHTASTSSPADDAHYMCEVADARPIANVLIDRGGTVWVLAAGPTNTNGQGFPVTWSKGVVPTDSMNSYAFGMELANDGVGEPYPERQVDAAFKVSNAVNLTMGNRPTDVATHFEWAPNRKLDPARADAVEGHWRPTGITPAGTWNGDDIRDECARRTVPHEEDDLAITLFECSDADAVFIGASSAGVAVHVSWADAAMAERYRAVPTVARQPVTVAQLQSMVLLGRLPVADTRHQWTGTEFAEVVS